MRKIKSLRRFTCLTLVLTVTLFNSLQAFSQVAFQRIGIAAGEIVSLGSSEVVSTVASYCMDEFKIAPEAFNSYGVAKPAYDKILTPTSAKVFVEGSQTPMSLKEAIDKGYINYVINHHDQVEFHRGPNALGKIDIHIEKDLFLGNDTDNAIGLKIPRMNDPILEKYFSKDFKQDNAWGNKPTEFEISEHIKEAQRVFKDLGLYNGAIDGKAGPNTISALKKFNQKRNLPLETPWSRKEGYPFEDFSYLLEDWNYYRIRIEDESKYLYTDASGNNTLVVHDIFRNRDFYLKVKTENDNLKLVDWGALDKNFYSEYERIFASKIRSVNDNKTKTSYISSIENGNATITIDGEDFQILLSPGTEYKQIVSVISEKLQERNIHQLTIFADQIKRNSYSEGLFRNEIVNSGGRSTLNLTRLVHDLSTAHSNIDFFIGTNSKTFLSNIKEQPIINNSADIHLVVKDPPLSPIDLIPEDQLLRIKENGLNYTKINSPWYVDPISSNTIVCMGDNGKDFYEHIENLAAEGLLKGKLLMAFTCHTPADIANYARLIEEYGLKGIVFYPDLIDPGAVRLVLQKIGTTIQEPLDSKNLIKIIRQAAGQVLQENPHMPIKMKAELQKLANPIIQVFKFKLSSFNQSIHLS